MNQALIILLCVGVLCPCGILARRWNTNKDSVVVDGKISFCKVVNFYFDFVLNEGFSYIL